MGEPHDLTCEMTKTVTARLPTERPRYLMGVGKPEQILDYVGLGVDMMDCVLPTRSARHGCLYTSEGRLLIRNAQYYAGSGVDRRSMQMRGLLEDTPCLLAASIFHRGILGDDP